MRRHPNPCPLVSATRTSQLVLACMLNNSHSMLLRYAVEYGPRSGSCQPIGGISARREESSGAAAGKLGQGRLDQACKVAVLQAQRVREIGRASCREGVEDAGA